MDEIHTLTPSIAKSKISGAMHEETYYGIKKIGDNTYKTIKKPLENLKKKDLDSIPDKLGGSKDIYQAILDWFGDIDNGADALKEHNGKYPINPNDKEHKEIKKIKIYNEYKNTGHMVHGSNVEKGSIYRIDIFKSKDEEDNNLYFVSYDIFEIKKINSFKENKNIDLNVKLDYGQGKNNIILPYSELISNYQLIISLSKNDLVKIKTKDNKESIAYIVGCSSGMLELKSKIGDGYDIIGDNEVFSKQLERYKITVSTIKEIKKLSINILGEISGL